MNRRHTFIIAAVGLTGFLFLCGCQPAAAPRLTKGKGPMGTLSIQQAAERLGLAVQKLEYPYIEMSGPNNRVLVFLYERGRVYVNGTPVGMAGKIQEIGGTYYISEMLIPQIRAAMAPSMGISAAPSITTPSLPSQIKTGTIVVDAGHGGRDPGTTSVYGTPEKVINLQIAHRLADILRQSGYHVVMTREGDTSMEKEERAAFANRINPDLLVSVHCDSISSASHKGFTVYIARQPSWTSTKIGRQLENSLSSAGVPSKGLRNADYVVLVQTRCPAVLVECGYLSNYDDATNLTSSWYQGKIARGIADGIMQSL